MQSKQQLDNVKEIVAQVYKDSNSYSNVIIAAGYVGFFALWSSLKEDLPMWAILSSGALILTSLLIFISFEVYKMCSSSLGLRRVANGLSRPNQNTLAEIQRIQTQMSINNARVWIFTVIPTVITGVGAGLILLICFLMELYASFQ
ncbi:hypothetical protein [Halomonas sp. AOP27-A1-34]|uniref:hypothetical protein n=1 Tax=Halomonas sp. AOP27-A1-34 TaxID=3457708 RepID=UPI00403490C1